MALVTDPGFLIYQLRISFLRTNDQTAERIIGFSDLAMPRAAQPVAPISSPATGGSRRRNTSASELRHHVAVQATVNPYIVACGYYPETDTVGSPDVQYTGGYAYSRPAVRKEIGAAAPPSARYPDRAVVGRNTNRNAKVAPTREGTEEVVGLGVVPRHADLLAGSAADYEPPTRRSIDTVRRRPSPVLRSEDVGSLSDGDGGRRSLDAMVQRGPNTIRLQRAGGSAGRRKGSARDAMALVDFDFSTIAEESSQEVRYLDSVVAGETGERKPASEPPKIRVQASPAELPAEPVRRVRGLRKNPSNMELRARQAEGAVKIPLKPIREGGLKRSATLPTRRAASGSGSGGTGSGTGGGGGNSDRPQIPLVAPQGRWAAGNLRILDGATAAATPVETGERPQDTWDRDSDDELASHGRRGMATKTWYGPRTAARPISLFPPVGNARPMPPPLPLMFGDGDSDDDIDLEGDDGSSKTPAMVGHAGLRGLRASPHSSVRSRSSSVKMHWPPFAPPKPVVPPSALENVRGELLAGSETLGVSRPRGRSDPEARTSARNSRVVAGSWSADATAGDKKPVAPGSSPAVRPRTGSLLVPSRPVSATGLVRSPPAEAFVPATPPAKSGLAALLANGGEVRANAFSEEYGGSGGSLQLKVFVFYEAQRTELSVGVKPTATVEQAIGYALHQYVDECHEPVLASDAQDVVMWALRIAEDGEIDDDFPALDRTRPVAKFAFDEFALCLATPEQVRQNEALRVRQGRPPRMARPASVVQHREPTATADPPAESADSTANTRRPLHYTLSERLHDQVAVLQQSRVATASTAGMFVGNALYASMPPLPPASAEPAEPAEPAPAARLLKVHVLGEPSSAEALRTTTVNAGGDLPVSQVLSHVCRKWAFCEDDFVLGIPDTPGLEVLPSDMLVAQIPAAAELCLYRADAPPPSADSLVRARQPAHHQNPPVPAPSAPAAHPQLAANYRIFPVVRRAQMFARHERSLVIDGEFVTLMPTAHRTDSAKTLTVHISNITCRLNQRSPKKLKLLINRPTATGDKSLDLEAESEDHALQICTIINRLNQRLLL